MEKQNSENRQNILKKKVEGLKLPDFKTYFKNYRSNQVNMVLAKNKHTYQCSRIEPRII